MSNLYQTPGASLASDGLETYQPKFLSLSGRIGRIRYLAYCMGIGLLAYAAAIPLALLMMAAGDSAGMVISILGMVALWVGIMVMTWGYAVRRLHDLNQTGWMSLLFIVPLVNIVFSFYLLFAPGTKGSNNYGPMPAPNSQVIWVVVIAVVVVIAILGILAAIAIPAYQEYILQAQEAQMYQ